MDEEGRRRYLRAKPMALAALDLDVAEREGYLATGCGDDTALRDEVNWMLQVAEHTGTSGFLCGVPAAVVDASGTHVRAAAGSDYRILRPLGEGGMGVVYLAERRIGDMQQRVALKFLRAGGASTSESLRRFADERRILAALAHPNIAHLIDGGNTADGRPFLALEYVEGERLDQWCERRRLSLRERVNLFLKVCAAVHYAHQHLVIHRDIKPANILVTADGEPKLLDFGIARLLDHVGGVASAQTITMQRALTLAYASPEQVRGQPLGTAADVWSLGVVLYQLVCGVRPFDTGDGDSLLDLSNAIVTGQLMPPGRQWRKTRTTVTGLRQVPADIDAIVLKALRRDPARRYASVDEFSADLRRFLAARPVHARQGRYWYRASLFVQRHRLSLGVAAVLAVVLGGFVAEREMQLHKVQVERDKTEAIAGFMSELFEGVDPARAPGNKLTVREVLDRGAMQLHARPDVAPAVRAALMLSIGRAYSALGMGEKATALLLEASELQVRTGASGFERGQVMAALARAYGRQADLPRSIAAGRQAVELLAGSPHDHADELLVARTHLLLEHARARDRPVAQIAGQLQSIVRELEAMGPSLPRAQLTTLGAALDRAGHDWQALDIAAAQVLAVADRLYRKGRPAPAVSNRQGPVASQPQSLLAGQRQADARAVALGGKD